MFRQWVLSKPLEGPLEPDHFQLREVPLPDPGPGQALVRVLLVNIHSATRKRMVAGGTKVGATDPTNFACGVVVKSRDPAFQEGDVIHCQAGWQEYQLVSSDDAAIGYPPVNELVKATNGTNSPFLYVFRPALVRMWSPSVLMDVLSTSGLTAYFGLRECGPLMPSDHVAVAGTSGSVGSMAAQLAKIAGARVMGFAGGEERCRWVVDTLGIDGCVDYKADDLDAELQARFPQGIDFFSDGVGGRVSEAALKLVKPNGRMFSYGSASALYGEGSGTGGPAPSIRHMMGITDEVEQKLRQRNIKAEAWMVIDFYHERMRAEDDLSRLMFTGRLKPITNLVEGFDKLPGAIADLYRKRRSGKLQVQFGTL
ncbi:NADP-dependent oxidoreductase [Ensifer sp. BR816]|uniref:MDR family NADP-dependent oxidoreductase n=1 Tax=Rhizobium sp. (strain BR816) TaxID=1057002 RepID=UPI001FDA5AF2|nr:NADP-dependent oxidoreductase [Ensifer sp. BR816]